LITIQLKPGPPAQHTDFETKKCQEIELQLAKLKRQLNELGQKIKQFI
jgi:hypothetical protein